MQNRLKAGKLAGFAVVMLAAAILIACGGDDKDSNSAAGASGGSTASGKKLNDCEYAAALLSATEKFASSLTVANVSTIAGKEEMLKAFDTFNSELATLINEMKSYQLSSDVAKVNNGMVAIFEDAKKQIPEVRRAIESGDMTKLTEASANLGQDVGARLDRIEQDNKATVDRLNKCES